MELSMDNIDIMAGGILAIMLALFMLTVIVTLFALSHRIRLLSNEIYKIETGERLHRRAVEKRKRQAGDRA